MDTNNQCIAFDETVVQNVDGLLSFNALKDGEFTIGGADSPFLTVKSKETATRRGAWQLFSPRIYIGTGSGSPTDLYGGGEYLDLGDLVYCYCTFDFTGAVSPAGPIKFSTPLKSRPSELDPTKFAANGLAHFYDSSANAHYSFSITGSDRGDNVTFVTCFGNGVQFGNSTPVTVANGDKISLTYCYRTFND